MGQPAGRASRLFKIYMVLEYVIVKNKSHNVLKKLWSFVIWIRRIWVKLLMQQCCQSLGRIKPLRAGEASPQSLPRELYVDYRRFFLLISILVLTGMYTRVVLFFFIWISVNCYCYMISQGNSNWVQNFWVLVRSTCFDALFMRHDSYPISFWY